MSDAEAPGLIAQLAFPDGVPYALIGKAIVVLLALVMLVAVVGTLVIALLVGWSRGWTRVSNRLWGPYDPTEGERPPLWRWRLAGVTAAMAHFNFREVPKVVRRRGDMCDDE